MQPIYMIIPLLALTACATPREQCLSDATRDASINAKLITQTEGNIARGYAVATKERVREVNKFCRGRTESGERVVTRCEDVRITKVRVPVAIDLNAERAKLASLKQQRAALNAALQTRVAQCQALPNG